MPPGLDQRERPTRAAGGSAAGRTESLRRPPRLGNLLAGTPKAGAWMTSAQSSPLSSPAWASPCAGGWKTFTPSVSSTRRPLAASTTWRITAPFRSQGVGTRRRTMEGLGRAATASARPVSWAARSSSSLPKESRPS
jgi:hypothetical protein